MDRAIDIRLAPGAETIGLAHMLRDLLTQNLADHPRKRRDFLKLRLKTGLTVPDAEVALTMDFDRGVLTIHPGVQEGSQLRIVSEADMVLALSNVRIKWGLPYYFDGPGKEVLEALGSGKIKVKGLIRHGPGLLRLSRIMSVH